MLRQIVIHIGHRKDGSVPQFLAMTYLDVATVQLPVMSKSPWNIKTGTIP